MLLNKKYLFVKIRKYSRLENTLNIVLICFWNPMKNRMVIREA